MGHGAGHGSPEEDDGHDYRKEDVDDAQHNAELGRFGGTPGSPDAEEEVVNGEDSCVLSVLQTFDVRVDANPHESLCHYVSRFILEDLDAMSLYI